MTIGGFKSFGDEPRRRNEQMTSLRAAVIHDNRGVAQELSGSHAVPFQGEEKSRYQVAAVTALLQPLLDDWRVKVDLAAINFCKTVGKDIEPNGHQLGQLEEVGPTWNDSVHYHDLAGTICALPSLRYLFNTQSLLPASLPSAEIFGNGLAAVVRHFHLLKPATYLLESEVSATIPESNKFRLVADRIAYQTSITATREIVPEMYQNFIHAVREQADIAREQPPNGGQAVYNGKYGSIIYERFFRDITAQIKRGWEHKLRMQSDPSTISGYELSEESLRFKTREIAERLVKDGLAERIRIFKCREYDVGIGIILEFPRFSLKLAKGLNPDNYSLDDLGSVTASYLLKFEEPGHIRFIRARQRKV